MKSDAASDFLFDPAEDWTAAQASAELRELWSPVQRVLVERELWLAVLEAQEALGVPTPDGAVRAYRRFLSVVNLDSIRQREKKTKHDLKARLDEFCFLANYQCVHRGLTSCDVTDNVQQFLIRSSLVLLSESLKKTELSDAAGRLVDFVVSYPLRGIKGATGTAQDQLDLLGGDHEKLAELERQVTAHLCFSRVMNSVGQVYPRSLDLSVVSLLHSVGREAYEIQRVRGRGRGFLAQLAGFETMAASISGGQWNEGDVSCSVVRRVLFPGSLFSLDALIQVCLRG